MNALAARLLSTAAQGRGPLLADRHRILSRRDVFATCAELVSVLRGVAGHPAPVVAVELPMGTDAVTFLLTAIVNDLVAVFLDPTWSDVRRAAVLNEVRPHVLVTARGVDAYAHDTRIQACDPSGYLAMSSGSTGGLPKGVLAAWDNVARFAPFGAAALELDASSVWAEATHLSYDMPMTNLLIALAAGCRLQLGTYGDTLRPLRFIDRVDATHVRMAPRSAELAAAERRRVRTGFRVWGSGGDRLLRRHVVSLHEAGAPVVVNTYGTSETMGFASAARLPSGADVAEHRGVVTVGSGMVGDWSVRLAGHERDSMLVLSSPALPAGYLFGGVADGGYPQWLSSHSVLTGDLGAVESGEYFCLGRTGRSVKRNGLFVDLDEVDRIIDEHLGVATHTVLTRGGELLALVETPADVDELGQQLAGLLTPERRPERLLVVDQIPRMANGKVDLARAVAVVDTAA